MQWIRCARCSQEKERAGIYTHGVLGHHVPYSLSVRYRCYRNKGKWCRTESNCIFIAEQIHWADLVFQTHSQPISKSDARTVNWEFVSQNSRANQEFYFKLKRDAVSWNMYSFRIWWLTRYSFCMESGAWTQPTHPVLERVSFTITEPGDLHQFP